MTIVDSRPPLSLTSSLSTECYRNYWGTHVPMTTFMNHSIDLLEQRAAESDNAFSLNRRSYCFVTKSEEGARRHRDMVAAARETGIGHGAVLSDGSHGREYRGHQLPYDAQVDGLSAFQGEDAISAFFKTIPEFLAPDVQSVLHCGRCGWMSAQQMGMTLLDTARAAGARTMVPATLRAISCSGDGNRGSGGARVSGVILKTPDDPELHIACGAVVNCAGPYASATSELMLRAASGAGDITGALPPLENEVHAKAILRDSASAVPSEAPMTIFEDEIVLEWSKDEKEALASMGGFEATLAGPLPAGAHYRPYPGSTNSLLMLWEALHMDLAVPEPPPEYPDLRGSLFAELLLRGLAKMSPALGDAYLAADGSMVASVSIDGGYYTKTPDNLPLIGPLPNAPKGAYVCAGLSGYGVMAANAAGDLLAGHIAGEDLPQAYADTFLPERWSDRAYTQRVASGAEGKGLQI